MAAEGGTPTSSAATHVFEMLRHLDAGRAAIAVEAAFHGLSEPLFVLPHIGWGSVVDDSTAAYRRYGFSSTGSFEVFEDLLRYLSQACSGLDGDWASARRALNRTADAVREIRAQTVDFARRRQLAKERAAAETDATVAGLLDAIGGVRSPRAWLRRSPESRLVECVPTEGYRLRLAFADGTTREIELGEDFWSTTGHAPDTAEFRRVRLDREGNRLVWDNGVDVPGERLHLAIKEGRL